MKHTKSSKPLADVTLSEAMARVPRLTQLQLEIESGIDRTRISKLMNVNDARVLHDTYLQLDGALRRLGGLKRNERLVFGSRPETMHSVGEKAAS